MPDESSDLPGSDAASAPGLPSIRDTPQGATFAVRVQPRARKTVITGVLGSTLGSESGTEGQALDRAVLKVSLSSPAIEGRANQALVELFASLFNVSRSAVTILAGAHSRNKVIRVAGVSAAEVLQRLAPEIPRLQDGQADR